MPRRSLYLALVGAAISIVAHTALGAGTEPPLHTWELIEGKHWQIDSGTATEDVSDADAPQESGGACTEEMVEVTGRMVVGSFGDFDTVDALQKTVCTDWISRTFPERCARFDQERWRAIAAKLPRQPMHFCIDRFEYPNKRGAYPWILVDWDDARAACAAGGKRLCTESEWTFACEGEEALPYPYGYERDAAACVIDRPWREVHAENLAPPGTERARAELDRLWQGERSGARPRCRSPFGVYDMTGNVDEWTTSVAGSGQPSILKGGYWGPVRTRCRPSTRIHGREFAFYQQGFRCCSSVAGAPP